MTERGVPIDEADMPAWARPHFSPAQLGLSKGLLWLLLLYKWRGRHPSRKSVAQRLHAFTIGRDRKEWDPTFAELAADLDLSERTVEPALEELEADGWILVTRLHRRNIYRLAWPVRDVLSPPVPEVPLCGHPTTKGGKCTKRAGRGTDTPGVGPCKQHLEDPAPEPLPLDLNDVRPQPLRSAEPVDNHEHEDPSTATVADFDRNHCGVQPQPLQLHTATVAVPYVSTFSTFDVREETPPVAAVGSPTVRNARAREAPTAQPRNSFAARSLITGIPRYRDAPGWVKKRYLTPMAVAALTAGFGRDAIHRYAQLVISEASYKPHHHIPEFWAALARLGRDVALGTACRRCAADPRDGLCCIDPSSDRPWTEQDQADLERVLEALTPTDAELDTGTT